MFSCLANVSRSGSIVVLGDPILANVSGFGKAVVVIIVTGSSLPACSDGFRGNMTYIIVVTFGGLPACYGGRCCCRCCKLLLSFLANVSRSGSIVVVGDPIFENVSGFGVVVAQGAGLRGHHFTEARAPKWTKVSKLPRRDALAAVTSLNNNIVYRIYCLFNNNTTKADFGCVSGFAGLCLGFGCV